MLPLRNCSLFSAAVALSLVIHIIVLIIVPTLGSGKTSGYSQRDLSFLVYELEAQTVLLKAPDDRASDVVHPENKTSSEESEVNSEKECGNKPESLPPVESLELFPLKPETIGAEKTIRQGEVKREELTPQRAQEILKEREEFYRKNQLSPVTILAEAERNKPYLVRIRERIQAKYFIPEEARRQGLKGKVTLKITVSRKGELLDVETTKHSDFPVLDMAAVAAIRAAAPFPDISDKIDKPALIISVPFIYP